MLATLGCSDPAGTGPRDANSGAEAETSSEGVGGVDAEDAAAADDGPPDGRVHAPDSYAPPPCIAAVVGKRGIGRSCTPGQGHCAGNFDAVTCMSVGEGAPFMCVEYCFGFPGECDGAVCMTRGDEPSVCVPAACAARYTVLVPSGVTCTDACDVVSELGVGKPCTTHEQCAGQVAKTCPYVFKADNQKWCSMLCSEDQDCGHGALCWRRTTLEHGVRFMIGSCTPAACCHKP